MANQYLPRFISSSHKECSLCGVVKEHSFFGKNKHNKNAFGLSYYCKACTKIKYTNFTRDTKKINLKVVEKKALRKQEAIQLFGDKCFDCGQTFPPCCYDFHHLDPSKKELNPANAVQYSKERYLKEISKCIMLCSNCHRIRHST